MTRSLQREGSRASELADLADQEGNPTQLD